MSFLSANGARWRRNAGFALGLLITIAGVLIATTPARADCAAGMVPTVDGMCMPRGNTDCGVGRGSCAPGLVCKSGSGCMPIGDVDCGPTRGSCPAGNVCMKGSGCMPAGSVDCSDGTYCSAGSYCSPDGKCRKY
jgi:hypothetical protein